MAVNLEPPRPENLLTIAGVRLGVARAGIRKPDRKDLLVVGMDKGRRGPAVFACNRFAAAPVVVCKRHLDEKGAIRAIVVNTGVANAGTGEDGIRRAEQTCAAVAAALDVERSQVLPLSTGVIMEALPVERIEAGLPPCVADLEAGPWASAPRAILTTPTLPKSGSRPGGIHRWTMPRVGI